MSRRTRGIVWSIFFLLLFALSLDYWRWDEPVELIFLNLPGWTLHFVILQLIFALAILLFIRNYWNKEKDES